jgi:hypothetical protein
MDSNKTEAACPCLKGCPHVCKDGEQLLTNPVCPCECHRPKQEEDPKTIIERLATEVMGWLPVRDSEILVRENLFATNPQEPSHEWDYVVNWNPITDWNHWRQVELKVMEDIVLSALFEDLMNERYTRGIMCIADLPTRAKALVDALDSLHHKNV